MSAVGTSTPPPITPIGKVQPGRTGASRGYFRTDVEGLRAIAVLAVVAFHASVPGLDGGFVGVDVFFVISGFLITNLLLREVQSTGRIDIRSFFARRARRIIPAAAVVLLATTAAAILLQPLLGLYNTTREVLASGLFLANWHFLSVGTDYFAAETVSPVLHYWSLAVEEQFYIVWPFLIIGAYALARRMPLLGARIMLLALGGVTAASLALSIVLTATDPDLAYMSTFTRAWEFGVGGLLAASSHWFQRIADGRRGRTAGWLLGWAGMAAIVASVLLLDERMPFPGAIALLPVLGTAAVIAGGMLVTTGRTAVGALLSLRPLRYLGRLSFGWYLWHWPVLVLTEQVTGTLPWQQRCLLAVLALGLAALTLHLLEMPISRWKTIAKAATPGIALGLLCTLAVTTLSLGIGSNAVARLSSSDSTATIDTASFEQVFGPGGGAQSGPVSPNPLDAPDDGPSTDCLYDGEVGDVIACTVGTPGGTPVALFGDSHAHQWLPAFERLGEERGWEVSVFAQAGCPANDIAPRDDDSLFSADTCVEWRQAAIAMIVDDIRPDLIVVSSLHTYLPDTAEVLESWDATLTQLRESGAPIAYLRDTPDPPDDVPACISSAFDDWQRCDFPQDGIEEPVIQQALTGGQPGVTVVDLLPYFCEDGTCRAVQNGLLLYRDASHITATAAAALAPALGAAFDEHDLIPAG